MSADFILEINGAGEAITLEPVGTVDLLAARTIIEALDTLRGEGQAAFLEIRLHRVSAMTVEARQALTGGGLPMDAVVFSGVA
jgi:hypothetical protein